MRVTTLYFLTLFLLIEILPGTSSAQCDTAWIVYPASTFCKNEADPRPLILGTTGGTFSASPNLALHQSTGQIDLSQSFPGTYGITYATAGPCPDTATEILEIHPPDNPWFQYNGTICENSPNPVPTVIVSGGRFSSLSGGLQLTNPFTGEINLDSTLSGSHLIEYRTNSSCPNDTSYIVTISPSPNPGFLFPDSTSTFCEGEDISIIAYGGDNYEFYLNDSLVRGLGEEPAFSLPPIVIDSGLLRVNVINDGGCKEVDSIQIRVTPAPALSNLNYKSVVSKPNDLEIFFTPEKDGTRITWEYNCEGLGIPVDSSGKTEYLQGGSYWRLAVAPQPLSLLDPIRVHYRLTPEAGICKGEVDSFVVTILPAGQDLFIPDVITPNGNGKNDFWEIRWDAGVNPDHYHIDVYNRSGGLVKRIESLSERWDGTGLADGTYWWVLYLDKEVVRMDGLVIKRK